MTPRGLRSISLFTGLGCAALALIGWSQTWFGVVLTGQFDAHPTLEVAGDVGAPAVAALALASAAGFAAMAISGPFFRVVLSLLEVALGASITLSAALAIASPVGAVSSAVTEATSLEGRVAVSGLIGSVTPTAWPYVSVVVGVLLAVIAIGILITGRLWPTSGRRYEPVRFEPAEQALSAELAETNPGDAAVSNWDELSGGSDPTSG